MSVLEYDGCISKAKCIHAEHNFKIKKKKKLIHQHTENSNKVNGCN